MFLVIMATLIIIQQIQRVTEWHWVSVLYSLIHTAALARCQRGLRNLNRFNGFLSSLSHSAPRQTVKTVRKIS